MNTGIDWSFWATVAGTIGTIVFGVWAIILAKKRPGYPGQMTYYDEAQIWLFNDIARNLKDLSIQYRGHPVQQNLVILRGYLLNTGHKDVSTEMVTIPTTFLLKDGYKFLEGKATSPTVGDASVKIENSNKIVLCYGLFRRDEFIRFEALVEAPNAGSTVGIMTVSQRIADTEIKAGGVIPISPDSISRAKLWEGRISSIAWGLVMVLFALEVYLNYRRGKGTDPTASILIGITMVLFTVAKIAEKMAAAKRRRVWKIIGQKTNSTAI